MATAADLLTLTAAGKPKRRTVSGPTLDELDEAADRMAILVARNLGRVAGRAARSLGGITTAAADLLHFEAPNQARDNRGRWTDGGGFEDPSTGDDGGDYGLGRDRHGVSYTEFDVDDKGEPRFSESYRVKYGPVTSETSLNSADGKHKVAVVQSEKGAFLHIGDDSQGTKHREVVQELDKRQAGQLSDGIYAVYSGERPSFSGPGGSHVVPAGPNPTRDGVTITWGNGRTMTFAGEAGDDAAFDLQESLGISGGTIASALTAADGSRERPSPVPSPRQAAVSADDIGMITDQWTVVVDTVLAPAVAADYAAAWQAQQARIIAAAGLSPEQVALFSQPTIDVQEAAQVAASAAWNRLKGIGDQLWGNARDSLVEGMAAGEPVPKLAARVQAAASVTAPRATMIARTESMNARNAGAYDEMGTAAALGIVESKTWLATHDARTRETHVLADGQTVPFASKFTVGGWPANSPHDPMLPAEEAANCRCTLIFNLTGEKPVYPLTAAEPMGALWTFEAPSQARDNPVGDWPARSGQVASDSLAAEGGLWTFEAPSQPRDAKGRWGSTGGGSPAAMHDEAQLRAAYDFTDPDTGYSTHVEEIHRPGDPNPDPNSLGRYPKVPPGRTMVTGTVRDANGKDIGQFCRTVHPASQARVNHDFLVIDPGHQGQGFAARFNANAEGVYRANGIKMITLHANIDVGGYAWARAGYDFRNGKTRAATAGRAWIDSINNNYDRGIRDEFHRLYKDRNTTPLELAMVGHTPGAKTWPGKEVMLDSNWEAVKIL